MERLFRYNLQTGCRIPRTSKWIGFYKSKYSNSIETWIRRLWL